MDAEHDMPHRVGSSMHKKAPVVLSHRGQEIHDSALLFALGAIPHGWGRLNGPNRCAWGCLGFSHSARAWRQRIMTRNIKNVAMASAAIKSTQTPMVKGMSQSRIGIGFLNMCSGADVSSEDKF